MANVEHLELLKQGTTKWNASRSVGGCLFPDLNRADVSGIDLSGANLSNASCISADFISANLQGANCQGADFSGALLIGANVSGATLKDALLSGANLEGADLTGADLTGANLYQAKLGGAKFSEREIRGAFLSGADLRLANLRRAKFSQVNLSDAFLSFSNLEGADLTRANLREANLTSVNLTMADLSGANLQSAILIGTNLDQATLTGCFVYGISTWALKGIPKDQSNLVITPEDAPTVTVDDLEVAQFVYLLLNRAKLRNVLNTITSKAVLILGRFTPERKAILDAMADELRKYNLLPIIFDFERATSRDFTETIKTLAGLSLFVIVDITNPKSAPLELQATVPDYQIPFVPIIQEGQNPFSMFRDLKGKYDWVLRPVMTYSSVEELLRGFKSVIVDRAWEKLKELQKQKTQETEVRSIDDFLKTDDLPQNPLRG